ncbi:hypothetical protein Gasu2_44180 [Galdieria sulphuraria]|uniref:Uncharacterized protein n=1 Tax=Galdieria sulphuraria TaxID=130081 RepID=M2Y684_GALSU|nr:uncharacterized protein Gasu_12080 [Galdieria sulphuraria]EME31533.1 hypothetical protein Gasu_12080 [Galdieria sulphuraria]GJD10211.1 hypothetical protein Gasu2_44180 [Galdieria sulphuraria]|eukprot:XP_005708053.1 hypothetical protein Gasu_12080 [Galdieria sulphuraria]
MQENPSSSPFERRMESYQTQDSNDLHQLWRPREEDLEKLYRVPLGLTNEQLVEKLQLFSGEGEEKTLFVWVNRDLLGYRFLFWLTGMVLKEKQDGDVEHANKLEIIRDWVIESVVKIDRFLVRRVKQAEEKLKSLIQDYDSFKTSPEKKLLQITGQSEMDFVCLWVVVYTAVIAWKLRAAQTESSATHPSSIVVSECRHLLEQKDVFQRKTPKGLKLVAQLFDRSIEELNPRLKTLGDTDIREIGRLMTILELLPADPYRLLCRIACNLYDGAILLQYGVENYQIGSVRFGLDPYSFDSESKIPKLNNPFITIGK